MTPIGFIGLGNMGAHMARNLIRAGHDLQVYDLNDETVRYVAQAGAKAAEGAADAATEVEFVVTMLPVGANVRSVLQGAGVIDAVAPGTVLIDASTIDVDTARAMHEAVVDAGYEFLDAPVSGGVGGAEAGTLTFMCGGDPKVFAKCRPILEGMGKNIVMCGGPGQGQVTKICNNMIAGITALACSEAFVLGETLGVDRKTLYDVISTSSGNSAVLNMMCPVSGVTKTHPRTMITSRASPLASCSKTCGSHKPRLYQPAHRRRLVRWRPPRLRSTTPMATATSTHPASSS